MQHTRIPFIEPGEDNSPLGRDQIVSRAARFLRPFHNIDIPHVAEAILCANGATFAEARDFAPAAARYELARRRAFA